MERMPDRRMAAGTLLSAWLNSADTRISRPRSTDATQPLTASIRPRFPTKIAPCDGKCHRLIQKCQETGNRRRIVLYSTQNV